MMQQAAQEFIKTLRKAGSHRSEREAFDAFLEFGYCAFAQMDATATPERREKLEARYMDEVGRWKVETVREVFPHLLAMTMTNCVHGDFLGQVAAETGALSASLGQFFTPWEICRLMAEMTGVCSPDHEAIKDRGFISLQEPAAGSGAMVLAHAHVAREKGLDVSTQLYVHATDLSSVAFRACYIQLSCAGIPAKVVHGNTLSNEVFETAHTPIFSHWYMAEQRRRQARSRQSAAVQNVRKRTRK